MTRDDKVELSFKVFKYVSFLVFVALFMLMAWFVLKFGVDTLEDMNKEAALNYSSESGVVQSVKNIVGTGIFSDNVSQEIVVNNQKYTLSSDFRYKFQKGQTVEFDYYVDSKNIAKVKTGDIQ